MFLVIRSRFFRRKTGVPAYADIAQFEELPRKLRRNSHPRAWFSLGIERSSESPQYAHEEGENPACLMHDIGYVRGILKSDGDGGYVVDAAGHKVSLHRGASDAALLPHHVDRSILFVLDRLKAIEPLDAERIARAIKITRFPPDSTEEQSADEEGWLLRAADLVGQLGDPNYLRKSNALFYEFEECGLNRQLGYTSPADIVGRYPQFFYNSVARRIQPAIRYLNVTSSGRQWIANLYSNLFRAEQNLSLSGPQS